MKIQLDPKDWPDVIDNIRRKMLCFFGFHEWKFNTWFSKYGAAVGDRCNNCGIWHKSAIRKPWDEINYNDSCEF